MISIKLQSNFIEIALRHGCSPVNLLHIFRTTFPKNISGWLLLELLDAPARDRLGEPIECLTYRTSNTDGSKGTVSLVKGDGTFCCIK